MNIHSNDVLYVIMQINMQSHMGKRVLCTMQTLSTLVWDNMLEFQIRWIQYCLFHMNQPFMKFSHQMPHLLQWQATATLGHKDEVVRLPLMDAHRLYIS